VRRFIALLIPAALLFGGCGSGSFSADPPAGSEDVSIPTPDGETLEATVVGDGPLGLVIAHGSNANREHWFEAGGELALTGDFTVVMLNLRGYQGSTGTARTNQDVDILAAVDWLEAERGVNSAALMGSSMGATSVLVAASQRPETITSVVALSPPRQSASMDAMAAVPTITMPVRLFVAEGDEVFVETTTALAVALSIEPRIMEGSGHGTGMFADNPELLDEIATFLHDAVAVDFFGGA
jgi:dienelactone hydrolase